MLSASANVIQTSKLRLQPGIVKAIPQRPTDT